MANSKEETKKPTHKVVKEFHDINDWDTVHAVGDDVSNFDAERLAKLVENGHVEAVKLAKPKGSDSNKPDNSGKSADATTDKADDSKKDEESDEGSDSNKDESKEG